MTIKNLFISLLALTATIGSSVYLNRLWQNSRQPSSISLPIKSDLTYSNNVGDEPPAVQYKLPAGKQVYSVSHGDKTIGPRAKSISYNPLSVEVGSAQIITVIFPKEETVSTATIFFATDNKTDIKVILKKNNQDDTNTWQGEWLNTDTILKHYNARLQFTGPSGIYENTMTFL